MVCSTAVCDRLCCACPRAPRVAARGYAAARSAERERSASGTMSPARAQSPEGAGTNAAHKQTWSHRCFVIAPSPWEHGP